MESLVAITVGAVALTAAVKRGAPRTMVMADMPFMSYQADEADAIRNAGRFMTQGLADMAQLLLQTPIDAEHSHVRWQFAVPKQADGSPTPIGVLFAREFVRQFGQDIPIWERKHYVARPVLCDGDGAIARFRSWASQFYAGAAGAGAPR